MLSFEPFDLSNDYILIKFDSNGATLVASEPHKDNTDPNPVCDTKPPAMPTPDRNPIDHKIWEPGKIYIQDDTVIFGGTKYRCIAPRCRAPIAPPFSSSWRVVPPRVVTKDTTLTSHYDYWKPEKVYYHGDTVFYGFKKYRCKHGTLSSDIPPNKHLDGWEIAYSDIEPEEQYCGHTNCDPGPPGPVGPAAPTQKHRPSAAKIPRKLPPHPSKTTGMPQTANLDARRQDGRCNMCGDEHPTSLTTYCLPIWYHLPLSKKWRKSVRPRDMNLCPSCAETIAERVLAATHPHLVCDPEFYPTQYKGEWKPNHVYDREDLVTYRGEVWGCICATYLGSHNPPPFGKDSWALLSSQPNYDKPTVTELERAINQLTQYLTLSGVPILTSEGTARDPRDIVNDLSEAWIPQLCELFTKVRNTPSATQDQNPKEGT